jgi:hypothetical protein
MSLPYSDIRFEDVVRTPFEPTLISLDETLAYIYGRKYLTCLQEGINHGLQLLSFVQGRDEKARGIVL